MNSGYTTVARLWHIKQLVNAIEWHFTTDEDKSIINSIMHVFSKEFRLGGAHHFLYKVDKSNTLRKSIEEYLDAKAVLKNWAISEDIEEKNIYKIAPLMLEKELIKHKFYKEISKDGKIVKVWANNPIVHHLPFRDTGYFEVDCTTDVSSYEPPQIAEMIQYAITILRTYYNFCKATKIKGVIQTPAQRLGIANKVYEWKDIIYLR